LKSGLVPWGRQLEFGHIKDQLGLPTGSMVAFLIGLGCALAAILTGLIFSASTVLDWQAVQVWRIEWLLARRLASWLESSSSVPRRADPCWRVFPSNSQTNVPVFDRTVQNPKSTLMHLFGSQAPPALRLVHAIQVMNWPRAPPQRMPFAIAAVT